MSLPSLCKFDGSQECSGNYQYSTVFPAGQAGRIPIGRFFRESPCKKASNLLE
ncbi:hypothetical protein OBV_06830 [Oscillibacter valericigenes Sjm18-20]|nr:hypothetical protein OBV_06830 [Oscillibacter valericigenes Sjm18-20]